MQSVTIRVPATTANLGPGYDCLGIALGLANRVTVTRQPETPDSKDGFHPGDAMAREAAETFFLKTSLPEFPFSWSIEGEVPRSRGMGSSVTVRLGLLSGLNVLAGSPSQNTTFLNSAPNWRGIRTTLHQRRSAASL